MHVGRQFFVHDNSLPLQHGAGRDHSPQLQSHVAFNVYAQTDHKVRDDKKMMEIRWLRGGDF
jgi:hypothetical protein